MHLHAVRYESLAQLLQIQRGDCGIADDDRAFAWEVRHQQFNALQQVAADVDRVAAFGQADSQGLHLSCGSVHLLQFFQSLLQLLQQHLHALLAGMDDDMGGLGIQRIAQIMQFLQFGARVLRLQQGAVVVVTSPLPQIMHTAFQIDDRPMLFHRRAVLRVEHGTSAGRQDDVVILQQVMDHTALARPKASFPFDIEDMRDRHAGTALNLLVTIDESLIELLGQQLADRGLAGPHHADEDDIATAEAGMSVRRIHFEIVAEKR